MAATVSVELVDRHGSRLDRAAITLAMLVPMKMAACSVATNHYPADGLFWYLPCALIFLTAGIRPARAAHRRGLVALLGAVAAAMLAFAVVQLFSGPGAGTIVSASDLLAMGLAAALNTLRILRQQRAARGLPMQADKTPPPG